MKVSNARKSNFELLRIISILGVIMLHYINANMGGGLKYVVEGSVNYYVLLFIVSINACAVNLFVLLTGYFMCENNTRVIRKPMELVIQVMLFSFALYILKCVVGNTAFGIKGMISSLIPTNYFVILYVVLYIISPYINIVINNLNAKSLLCMVVVCVIALAVYPTLVDVFDVITNTTHNGLSSIGLYGSQSGYTIVNFILMYLIGALIKKRDIKINIAIKIVAFIINGVIITIWSVFDQQTAWEYCNPLVIIEAILLFLCFKDINIKNNKVVNSISSSVFSVFLLHTFFLRYIKIEEAVNYSVPLMLVHIICSSVGILFICYLVHLVYSTIMRWIVNKDVYRWTV